MILNVAEWFSRFDLWAFFCLVRGPEKLRIKEERKRLGKLNQEALNSAERSERAIMAIAVDDRILSIAMGVAGSPRAGWFLWKMPIWDVEF